jgi:pyridoxal phosphate enzyme (YggS family)
LNRGEEVSQSLRQIREQIPVGVTLIVVTKTFPVSDIEILYSLGERHFGENRNSEGLLKSSQLPRDCSWHFQGGIQSNKIKSIVSWAEYIHSLDDLSHAKRIDSAAGELGKRQRVFIQINLDSQDLGNRSGVSESEFLGFAESTLGLANLEVMGVMGIGEPGEDPRPGFRRLAALSKRLCELEPKATAISAGMSGDFQVAIAEGATHVRVGSSILGSRTSPL